MPRTSNPVKQVVRNGTKYWRARATYPFNAELGYKPKPKVFYGTTAREAIAKRDQYDPTKEPLGVGVRTQFTDYILTVFIPHEEARYNNGDLSWQRFSNRKSRLKRFILEPSDQALRDSAIRQVSLGRITPAMVEAFFTLMEIQGVSGYNRTGLFDDLRLTLRLAKRSIPHPVVTYFEDICKPTIKRKTPKVYDEQVVFTAITDQTLPLEDRAFVAFLFFTQCRPSEMFALTWADLDLVRGVVSFRKAVRAVREGYDVTEGTKTGERGIRTIPIAPTLAAMLRDIQRTRMASGNATDWVFHLNGTGLNKERSRYRWRAAKKALKLPDGPTLYSLKKTGNSFLARQGVSAEVRAKIMGHTTTRMAQSTYRDIVESEVIAAVSKFEIDNHTPLKTTG